MEVEYFYLEGGAVSPAGNPHSFLVVLSVGLGLLLYVVLTDVLASH